MDGHNKAFEIKVLKNNMFDDYDKKIIMAHLSNFYCVFQLGFEAGSGVNKQKVKDAINKSILREKVGEGYAETDCLSKARLEEELGLE